MQRYISAQQHGIYDMEDEFISPITQPELEKLLKHIHAYRQDALKNAQVRPRTPSEIVNDIKPHRSPSDTGHAANIQSPLTSFFTALILLDENPQALEQRHLDSMCLEADKERSMAFNAYGLTGGKYFMDCLEKQGLLIPFTGAKDRFQHYDLDWDFHKLAITPLDEVKKMVGEIQKGGTGTVSDFASEVSQHYSQPTGNANDTASGFGYDSPLPASFAKTPASDEHDVQKHLKAQQDNDHAQEDALRQQRLLIWQNEALRAQQIAAENALLAHLAEEDIGRAQRRQLQRERDEKEQKKISTTTDTGENPAVGAANDKQHSLQS